MKIQLLLAIGLVALACSGSAVAGSNTTGFGLGVLLGEPNGLSAKLWSDNDTAFDFGLAWSSKKHAGETLHADYVWHKMDAIDVDAGALPFYYGIGILYLSRDFGDDTIGVRFPLGLDYLFAESAFDIFLEIVPVLDLAPDSDFDINAALGGRFFF